MARFARLPHGRQLVLRESLFHVRSTSLTVQCSLLFGCTPSSFLPSHCRQHEVPEWRTSLKTASQRCWSTSERQLDVRPTLRRFLLFDCRPSFPAPIDCRVCFMAYCIVALAPIRSAGTMDPRPCVSLAFGKNQMPSFVLFCCEPPYFLSTHRRTRVISYRCTSLTKYCQRTDPHPSASLAFGKNGEQ